MRLYFDSRESREYTADMYPRSIRGLFAVAGIGAVALMLGTFGEAYLKEPPDRTLSEREAFWQEEIRAKGGAEAYHELAVSNADKSIDDQHQEAHAFGVALFVEKGVDALSICDSRFSYGCFHEFLGTAIATLGTESIPALNDACYKDLAESPLSCQHGIGHGAISVFGYDKAALLSALNECKNLKRSDPIGGCYGGVFMEYNVRTMLGADATPREYSGNPFTPCDSLSEPFRTPCIYWQPQWWQQAILYEKAVSEQFKEMGNYCREFSKTPDLERTCFEGIGNVVAQAAGYKPVRMRELCDAAAVTARQDLLCRSVGANHVGIDAGKDEAEAVCKGVEESSYDYCVSYARNDANAVVVIPVPL